MDKKQQSRAAPELKKQDVTSSKPWPRSSKKRESANNAPPKDATRKPLPARGKAFDKRPRPRGGYHGGGKTETRLESDLEAEVGSVFLPGSKKHNLNHLLNFHYAPRDGVVGHASGRGNRKSHGLVYTDTHKHNKELFLQSNCQFIVKAGGDYAPYLINPDIPISWDVIEQINMRVNGPLNCPICLGEAVAGRITKCGHIYCWACLLHYFALSESSIRPCPICFQPIDKVNLKSVQGLWQHYVSVGEEIQMKLMRCKRGSTVVEIAPPSDANVNANQTRDPLPSVSERESSSLFVKLLTASPREVSDIINREREELNKGLSPDLEHPQFILEALHLLQLREDKLFASYFEEAPKKRNKSESELSHCSSEHDVFPFENHDCESASVASSSTSCTDPGKVDDKYYYFYQASDGQATFLHGLNNRILQATWGNLSTAPRELTGNILERASGSVGMEARRRLRCLQHLPIHCPYDLVEIQLRPPFVTEEALMMFKNDLDERKRQRQRRARDEKRREKVISHQERVIMGYVPELEINLDSEEHFPAYQPDLDLSPPSEWKFERVSDGSSSGASSAPKQETGGLSFAKMASTTGTWKVRSPIVTAAPQTRNEPENSEDELGIPPAYNLGDAITEALLNTSLTSNDETPARDGKKKKKFKPKVLFTTGIQHRTAND